MAKKNWQPWMTPNDFPEGEPREASPAPRCACGANGWLWTPCADVLETPKGLMVFVELPGARRESINVEIRGNELWIWGERPAERAPGRNVFHAVERSHGPFSRSFRLPPDADKSSITASYRDGLLSVAVGRRAAARRSITVE